MFCDCQQYLVMLAICVLRCCIFGYNFNRVREHWKASSNLCEEVPIECWIISIVVMRKRLCIYLSPDHFQTPVKYWLYWDKSSERERLGIVDITSLLQQNRLQHSMHVCYSMYVHVLRKGDKKITPCRVRTDPGKSCNFIVQNSRPGKSWKKA